MAATMRAAVCHGARDIRIETVPRPRPEPGEVLVRVHANGICGTDASEFVSPRMYPLHARHGLTGHEGPLIPGHEFAGTIAEIGDGVEGFREGEPVVTGAALWCGVCPQCRAGRTSICALYATVGLHRDGGLAEYVRVPAHVVFRAEPFGLGGDLAVLTQPMAIAVHALRRGAPSADELAGRQVVVIGAGGIGAFLTYALARAGAQVLAVDVEGSRLGVARELGAADAVLTGARTAHDEPLSPGESEGEPATLSRALAQRGIATPLVFEVTGTDAGFAAAVAAVEPGGRVVTVGIAKHPIAIDARRVTTKELELIGTNALIGRDDVPEAARLLALEPSLWQHVAPSAIPLDRVVEDGIVPMLQGRAAQIKLLVDPWTPRSRPTAMRPD
ncbi:MAG TPA: alcohol dehydrogenase catalytic domain-containing protein [Candidatus Elarobacter sp.]|jgi:(R,R)-butanediol dehydrogenase/meso-butanediol dehydrogenase/diacetyl reductase|nr:alcohol dehydrogenase catalytic domain-containing protein [Candidatus Elarobacter sp.]